MKDERSDLPLLPDGTLDTQGDFGNAFDDVLDELHSVQGDASAAPHTAEREQIEGQERWFLDQLKHEVTSRLVSSGMWVTGAQLDRTDGESYLIELTDGQRRYFKLHLTLDEALHTAEAHGEDAGREIIDLVVKRALEERARYFARMH